MDGGEESETELLINAVHARPFLYNRKDLNYKKVYMKKQAWEHIASKIPSFEDASAAERRWNSLRGKYSTELLRMGSDNRPINIWKYFEKLAFLRDHVNPRTNLYQSCQNNVPIYRHIPETSNSWSPSNVSPNLSHSVDNNNSEYYNNLLNLLNNDEESNDNNYNGDAVLDEPPPKTQKRSTSHNHPITSVPQKHQFPKRSSLRIFGEYVGEFLEEMGDDSLEIQMKIMQVLKDYKMKQSECGNKQFE